MPLDDRLRQLMAQGREHYEKREWDQAEPFIKQALQVAAGFADLHNMLGVVYHAQGRFTQAEACFEQALKINPSYTESALNLAVTYNDLGKYNEAKEVYGKAMASSVGGPKQLDPFARGKLANMHADVGDAYHALGLHEDAAAEFRKSLELAPHFADLRTKLAASLRDGGRLEEARVELERAKRDNPKYMPARVNLGLTMYSLGRKDEAIKEWESVLVEDPANARCKTYLQMVKT